MKRIFTLLAIIFVCMGGCHKSHYELHIEAPEQEPEPQCLTVGESLQVKRDEFAAKLVELRRLLSKQRVQQRNDTLIVALPAWYPVTQ